MYNNQITEYFNERNYIGTLGDMDYVRDDSPQISYKFDKELKAYYLYKFWTSKDVLYHNHKGEPFVGNEDKEWFIYVKK